MQGVHMEQYLCYLSLALQADCVWSWILNGHENSTLRFFFVFEILSLLKKKRKEIFLERFGCCVMTVGIDPDLMWILKLDEFLQQQNEETNA